MGKIKIGVYGAGVRGIDLAKNFMLLDCEIVAVCEFREERKAVVFEQLGNDIAWYDDFDSFIKHDMDAVILANFFHEHAPYAIKCFEKGIHVFSECISNGTMAEGVELIRAAEKSSSIYMLAENYPQMIFNREIKRVCDTGTLGKILYAEGEYNHPANPMDVEFIKNYIYTLEHWRNYLPRTYYITHSLGPIMYATGATPKTVTAFAAFDPVGDDALSAKHVGDAAAIITTLNDNGSIFRVTGCAAFGAHHNAYRVCGTNGQVENLRGMGEQIMLRYNSWSTPEGAEETSLYQPQWNDKDEEIIKNSGHGGGDYITARMFIECIKEGKQPEHPFNLHSAVAMSSVAILAHRSMLEGGKPYSIPDFTLEECRKEYENDRLSPFYESIGTENEISCSSRLDYKPADTQLEKVKEMVTDR